MRLTERKRNSDGTGVAKQNLEEVVKIVADKITYADAVCNAMSSSVRKQAYNKAIDDYKSNLKVYLRTFNVKSVGDADFDYIAEQLKGGN